MSNTPICDTDTPDPWMLYHNNTYYLTFTAGDRVEIWSSPSMENFRGASKTIAWRPQPGTPWSCDLWAPELHYLNGTWYVYLCAAHPGQGNPSHRTVLLRSASTDPMDPEGWSFIGELDGLPDHWNIDLTVFTLNQRLYACYSSWPLGDFSDTQQDLFLVELATPETVLRGSQVCISRAGLPWERPEGGRRGVNEGPTWLSTPGFQGIVYSANGSWTSDYTLGLLQFLGGNPLNPDSWWKRPVPLLVSHKGLGGPFGPGHASFITNDEKVYCIYHATERDNEGWNNRKARVLCLHPSCFQPQAQTLCCSLVTTPNRPQPQPQSQLQRFQQQSPPSQNQYPGNTTQYPQQQQQQQQQQQGRHVFQQFGNTLMKKARDFSS
ncbi:alpha-L-arabinofuranosidase II [Exophiala viscosa]|uniref:alpha-L-arabinofuranosidase II n=1 Tax=Exophiala viscosa TaxID=2486360 RepID=UPI0021934B22|nr:alpha-L-arabinofuranosidase II [Exophiala viscosa]